MTFHKMSIAVASLTLLLALPALNGCSHLPYQSAETISGHSMSVKKSGLKVAARVDKTMAALNTLLNKPSGSLANDYKSFSDKVSSLKSGYADLKGAIDNVSGTQGKYMATWDKQIQSISNSGIQAVAKSNYSNAQADFSRFTKRAKTTESSGGALLKYLGNMKTYLAADLSTSGIQGASGLLGKAKSRAATFKHELAKLDSAASRLTNDLKPAAGASK